MNKMIKWSSTGLLLACACLKPSFATENGLISYPVGVNTVLSGITPNPGGTQFYNYTQYYEADKFVGADGSSLIPNFKVKAFVDAPRVVHTWRSPLGPFTMSSGIIVPLVHVAVAVPGASAAENGVGDIILEPLFIGIANESHTLFAFVAPFDVAVPTGRYSKTSVANTGANYFAFLPSLNVSWFPSAAWEFSATAVTEINTRNRATGYKSGKVAVLDYIVGYSITKKLQLGMQGAYLKQFSDDKVNGATLQDGFRGRASMIGPQLRYDFMPGGGILFKYQREFAVHNRSEGNRFWMEISMPL